MLRLARFADRYAEDDSVLQIEMDRSAMSTFEILRLID